MWSIEMLPKSDKQSVTADMMGPSVPGIFLMLPLAAHGLDVQQVNSVTLANIGYDVQGV